MNYNELTRRYFTSAAGAAGAANAASAGQLRGADVFRGAAGDREQGTWVQFDLQIRSGKVTAARFLAFACPHTVAVSAWLAEQAVGKPLRSSLPESVQALQERFAVPVEKTGRLLIIEDAWLAAAVPAIDYGV